MSLKQFRARQQAKRSPLIGLTLSTFDPAFVDIAAHIGIDIIWIEMEHSGMTVREAENLCRIINGNSMLSLIRLPNGERNSVLKAAEAGPDLLMIPMVDEAAELTRFVSHAKYAPEGERGFYRLSRAMKYGLGGTVADLRRQANENLMLWGQIETRAALTNLEELSQVPGIDGLFMGPGDLSSAFGVPGDTTDRRVIDAVAAGIAISRTHNRCSGTASPPADLDRWVAQSVDMLIVGSNIGFYIDAAKSLRDQLQSVPTGSVDDERRLDAGTIVRWDGPQDTTAALHGNGPLRVRMPGNGQRPDTLQ